jgi:RNA polymerase-associated protein
MGVAANRRSMMLLFTGDTDIYSHRIRLVMGEKGVNAEMVSVAPGERNEDLIELNPYNSLPTLIDRDLVLYGSQVIMEYIDERFPHPPLMPVDPVSRAQFRLALFRIEKDWYTQAQQIEDAVDKRQAARARKILAESIIASADVFAIKQYFLSDDFSLVDCSIAPILWRLPVYGIDLGDETQAIEQYMETVFSRPSFQESLSELEQEMRP